MYVPWQFAEKIKKLKNGMSPRVARPDQTDKLVPVGAVLLCWVVVVVCRRRRIGSGGRGGWH